MTTLKNKFITASGAVALAGIAGALLYGFVVMAFANGLPHNVINDIEIIGQSQMNAAPAHDSLKKAKEVTLAAEQVLKEAKEAENKAQEIVNGYSNTANTSRTNICKVENGKYCTRENLDPMNTGINLDSFFLKSR